MSEKRIDQLDGIRAIAISTVFLHHALQIKMLWAGVDLFFVLSGFLITGILFRSKTQSLSTYFGHFYKRRAMRILPPYALLLVLTVVLFGTGWLVYWYFYLFLMNFVKVLGIPRPETFSMLWSLAVEEQFYLVWPFVIYFCSERVVAAIAVGLFFAAPVLRGVCAPFFSTHWAVYMLLPFRMDLLAAGALLSILWRRRIDLIQRYGQYGLAASAIAVTALVALSRRPGFTTSANTPSPNIWIYELSLIASTGAILWALSGRGVGILLLSPLRYLGRISYTFYLIHLTAIVLIRRVVPNPYLVALAAFASALAYATLSWFFMELPLLGKDPKPSPVPAEIESPCER